MRIRLLLPKPLAIALVVGAGSLLSAPAFAETPLHLSSSSSSQLLAQASNTIVDVAAGNDNFDTLVQAVQTAGLADTLSSEGPYTVFAPTDDAFDALPDGAVEALLQPENRDLLTDILTYHVVPGEVTSDELETGLVDTLNGGVAVRVDPDNIIVNDASVVTPDVQASNGVIHAINRVLIPPQTRTELTRRLQASQAQTTPAQTTQTQTTQPTETQAVPALW